MPEFSGEGNCRQRAVSWDLTSTLTPKPEPHAVVDEVLGDTGGGRMCGCCEL